MSIAHAISGEPIDVAPYDSRLGEQRSAALFKSEQLEVIRLVRVAIGPLELGALGKGQWRELTPV